MPCLDQGLGIAPGRWRSRASALRWIEQLAGQWYTGPAKDIFCPYRLAVLNQKCPFFGLIHFSTPNTNAVLAHQPFDFDPSKVAAGRKCKAMQWAMRKSPYPSV